MQHSQSQLFFAFLVFVVVPGVLQLILLLLPRRSHHRHDHHRYRRQFTSLPVVALIHTTPTFWNFFWRVLILQQSFSLHCHYHNNDYDRTRWLLITQRIFLIDNMGYFVPHPSVLWIAIHLIKWSSSLDRSVMSLICIHPYSYCIH